MYHNLTLLSKENVPLGIVNVLKFRTLVVQKVIDKQRRPRSSLIRVFPVCYSDKHFVNCSPDNQHFI